MAVLFYFLIIFLKISIPELIEVELTHRFFFLSCRLYLADEQLLQNVTSVQQLANMETELEQALERVRSRKVC